MIPSYDFRNQLFGKLKPLRLAVDQVTAIKTLLSCSGDKSESAEALTF